MTQTRNHSYNVPAKGTKDWHLLLNENFDQFDRDIEIRNTEANRESHEPRAGAKFEATDSGAVYLGDGSEWILADRRFAAVQAAELSGTVWFVDPDEGNLQEQIDAAAEAGGGEVRLLPGIHDSHDYPVEIPNGVTLRGWNQSVGATVHCEACVLDADGGVAIRMADRDTAGSITLSNFAVVGTVRFDAPTNRNFIVRDLYISAADVDKGSGRGLEILNSSYLYRVENVQVGACDGAGVYVRGDGQAMFHQVSAFYCGNRRDHCNHYYSSADVGGGEGQYVRLVCAGFGDPASNPDVDGIVFEDAYLPDIYSPQIEDHPRDGLRFTATNKTANPSVYGGHIFGSGRHNIHAEDVVGLHIDGPTLRLADDTNNWGGNFSDPHSGGKDILFSDDTSGCHVSSVFGMTNTVHSMGYVSVENQGWHNSASSAVTRSLRGGPQGTPSPIVDVTRAPPTFHNEMQFHDGSGPLPKGPAIAWRDHWMSLIDGTEY